MTYSFAESREALRSLLVSGSAANADADWKPRSRIMRAAVNPDNRAVFLAVATLATLVFPPLTRAGMFYPLLSKVAKASRHISKMRFLR